MMRQVAIYGKGGGFRQETAAFACLQSGCCARRADVFLDFPLNICYA